ncbi:MULTISPECIES: antitoxin Xre/MbcA/ParS toxin-binding domain-containing protein [unclassified Bosea (in: a-proteobacteria)]|uniref:type II RES/Xre toxin-antitoxin system antitoxin n=1 Tax=unclassified Bosea (in: a-proteobacteria) TaxID=2653178 RepID=UPI000F7F499A|nr:MULTISPECIES: antitoxin Xre/MbcA/ParS toxin-binding domain-containing protein [unclassified Bosea (in: a-proteobacteria)]RXT17499.1 toxin-antitoxin system antitoxin component family protein [Bosea sp. Tri-39]RXT40871.1 toxin-antitoxin system antitoxin component family protein [Bosea sp. Tri-54]
MVALTALDVVGGQAALGGPAASSRDLIAAVRRGFPVRTIEHVIESGRMTLAEIDELVLPRKTLSHRRKIGTLTTEQSDRLMRAARVIAEAEVTFGSQDKAGRWLRRPTSALDGEKPLALLDTGEGAAQVEALLGRIAHGIAA